MIDTHKAATLLADAWNRLDPERLIARLAPEVRYTSQWVLADMNDRDSVAEYLRGKMVTVRESGDIPRAALGRTYDPFRGIDRDCVLIFQYDDKRPDIVMLVEVEHDQITRIDLCMPELLGAHTAQR